MVQINRNCVKKITGSKVSIKCSQGALWITYKNSADIILESGEDIQIRNKRDVMIQGLTESKYIISNINRH